MIEHYEIESIEQLRAVSDMLRIRIVELLKDQPKTATQLADLLAMTPARVHYHVRELEKVGLLRLVETREKSGILEKYYQAVARDISIPRNLLFSAPPDEIMATVSSWLDQIKDGFLQTMRHSIRARDENNPMQAVLGFSRIYTTYREFDELVKQWNALLKPFEERRGIEGEQEILASLVFSPQDQATSEREEAVSTRTGPEENGLLISPPGLEEPGMLNTWVLGVTSFTRAQLEEALGEGKRLHISVVGLCRFNEDVTAELADQAIASFRLVGKLEASPPVYEIIMSKRQA